MTSSLSLQAVCLACTAGFVLAASCTPTIQPWQLAGRYEAVWVRELPDVQTQFVENLLSPVEDFWLELSRDGSFSGAIGLPLPIPSQGDGEVASPTATDPIARLGVPRSITGRWRLEGLTLILEPESIDDRPKAVEPTEGGAEDRLFRPWRMTVDEAGLTLSSIADLGRWGKLVFRRKEVP
ncbi:MAG: hypothetical protein N2109_11705 [Fimbriimonadales bacterium]|nr:hypothetical protein [Fimbriimonadales bacterium]